MSLARLRSGLCAIRIVWQRDLIRFYKDRGRAVATLLQPIMNLFVLGTGLAAMTGRAGVDLRTVIFPGVIAMAVMFTALFSAGSVVSDREFGFMREMLVAPVSRAAIVIGKCLGGATTAAIQGLLLLSLAGFVGVPYDPALMLTLLGEALLLAFTVSAFGMMLATRAATMQAFMGSVQLFMMPLFLLSGAMFPLANLPPWLVAFTHVNPLTYAVDPMRRAVLAASDIPPSATALLGPGVRWGSWVVPTVVELLVVAGLGSVMLAITVARFQRIE